MNAALPVIALFLALALCAGVRAKGGRHMTMEQWTIGGRGFGTPLVFVLMAGENFTTFAFLGASGWTYGKGAPAFYILAYGCLAYVLSYWLLPCIWRYAKQHRLVSLPDFFVSKYQSKGLGILVALVAALGMGALLTVQLRGLGIIVAEASYGQISPALAVGLGAITMVAYVGVSGIHGSVRIAVFKDILILALAIFLGIYLPLHYYGGFATMFAVIDAAHPGVLRLPAQGLNPAWYNSTILLLALGYYLYPHTFTSVYSANSAKAVRKNAILMPLYQVVLLCMFFVGFAAIMQVPGLKGADADLALLRLAKQSFDPWFVGVIGGTGVLTALVPGSMILLNAATLLAKNVYRPGFAPHSCDARLRSVARRILPWFALIAVYLVLRGGASFVTLSLFASGLLTQLFPPFMGSLLPGAFGNKFGAFAGIAAGTAIMGYFALSDTTLAQQLPNWPGAIRDLNPGAVALIVNALVFVLVSWGARVRSSAAAR